MVLPPLTENPRFEGGENGDNDYPLVATSDGEAVSSPSPSAAASTPTAASAPTGGSCDRFVRRRLFVPDWVNHPTNCSFALGRTVSTGGDQYKLLRIRTDRVLQVCSVLALGGDGINSGSFLRWRKVPSPPQNVFTGRRSVAVDDGESAEAVVVLDDGRVVFWVWDTTFTHADAGGVMLVYDPATGGQTEVAAMAGAVHVGVYTGSLLRLRN
uniref:Uncharacterized protein n=1 Tax=Oryza barthii TaxID=65489 RepID=A0A0D3GP22_9ORYZ